MLNKGRQNIIMMQRRRGELTCVSEMMTVRVLKARREMGERSPRAPASTHRFRLRGPSFVGWSFEARGPPRPVRSIGPRGGPTH